MIELCEKMADTNATVGRGTGEGAEGGGRGTRCAGREAEEGQGAVGFGRYGGWTVNVKAGSDTWHVVDGGVGWVKV